MDRGRQLAVGLARMHCCGGLPPGPWGFAAVAAAPVARRAGEGLPAARLDGVGAWASGAWPRHLLGHNGWRRCRPTLLRPSRSPNRWRRTPAPPQPGRAGWRTGTHRWPRSRWSAWASSALAFWAIAGWGYTRLTRAIRSARAIDEGPHRVALERMALELGVRRVPELLATQITSGPFLLGVIRPRVVLPETSLDELNELDLRAVLTHELVHWRRGDTWVGCVQVAAQGIFWFHPFLWWAGWQLRHERKCACDQTVLDLGHIAAARVRRVDLSRADRRRVGGRSWPAAWLAYSNGARNYRTDWRAS